MIPTHYWLILALLCPLPLSADTATGEHLAGKARTAIETGKPRDAVKYYDRALKVDPDSQQIWMGYTVALRHSKHLQRAAQAGWRTLELGKATAGMWSNLGNIFLEARAWEAASNAFDKSSAFSTSKKEDIQNYLNLGYWQWLVGNYPSAEVAYNKALKLAPNNGKVILDLGALLASQGKIKEGSAKLRRAKKLLSKSRDLASVSYIDKLLQEIRTKNKLVPPHNPAPYENLPKRFLKQPKAGKALSLKVDPFVTRFYPVKAKMKISLRIDETWNETFSLPKKDRPSTITYKPGTGEDFLLTITLYPINYDKKEMRAIAKRSADHVGKTSIEKKIELRNIQSSTMSGFYFLATDKNAASFKGQADKYPHILSAILKANDATAILNLHYQSEKRNYISPFLGIFQTLKRL